MILLALGAALADESARVWESLYDARLVEAADGTPEVAILYYEEIVADLSPDDPTYGMAWYWLGRTRYGLGDTTGAATALRNALRDEAVRPQAAALLGRLAMKERAIRALPYAFGFDGGSTGAFVRAWEVEDKGKLEARAEGGQSVLAWETTVRGGEADHVGAALDLDGRVKNVRFQVRSSAFPAELRVTLSDGAGGRYSAPVIQVPTGQWLQVDLPASVFRSTDGARGGGGNALRPSDPVRMVEIEDLTGLLSPDRGTNTLYVDAFEIR